MAKITIRATLHVAWWWKFYCVGLVAMVRLTGMPPNWERVEYWSARAVTIKFVGGKR